MVHKKLEGAPTMISAGWLGRAFRSKVHLSESAEAASIIFFERADRYAKLDGLDQGTRIRLRDFNGPQLEPSDMSTEAHDVP